MGGDEWTLCEKLIDFHWIMFVLIFTTYSTLITTSSQHAWNHLCADVVQSVLHRWTERRVDAVRSQAITK